MLLIFIIELLLSSGARLAGEYTTIKERENTVNLLPLYKKHFQSSSGLQITKSFLLGGEWSHRRYIGKRILVMQAKIEKLSE
jgi:hypothetical protein